MTENLIPTSNREHKIYNQGVDEGRKHRAPSNKTLEKFGHMGDEITKIKETLVRHGVNIDYIKKNSDEMKKSFQKANDDMKELLEKFIKHADENYAEKENTENVIEKAPDKFAGKQVEKVVYGFIAMVLTASAGVIIKIIIPE